jgi:hypothetical protein
MTSSPIGYDIIYFENTGFQDTISPRVFYWALRALYPDNPTTLVPFTDPSSFEMYIHENRSRITGYYQFVNFTYCLAVKSKNIELILR